MNCRIASWRPPMRMQRPGGVAGAGNVMVIGGIAGILTSWNAFIVGASRAIYAMARSGMLPAWLGHLHPKYNTPHRAVILIGVHRADLPAVWSPGADLADRCRRVRGDYCVRVGCAVVSCAAQTRCGSRTPVSRRKRQSCRYRSTRAVGRIVLGLSAGQPCLLDLALRMADRVALGADWCGSVRSDANNQGQS